MWRKARPSLVLIVLGGLFAAGNVWFAASRSTIPWKLNDRLVEKEIRGEKHPGSDDVHWLRFESGLAMQVDRAVFESVRVGDHLRKAAWSHALDHGDSRTQLNWSADCRGMAWAMPLIVIALLSTAAAQIALRNQSAA